MSSASLRLMTYNVRYFGHGTRGLASTNDAITRIASSIAALSPLPHLVCLQEVETQSIRSSTIARPWHPDETQLERLMTELHAALRLAHKRDTYRAYYFPAHAYRLTKRTNIYTTGLAVLIHDSLEVAHDNARTPHDITHRVRVKGLKQTRICAHLSLRDGHGRTLDVFNTHLSLPSWLSREFWTSEARMGFGPNQLAEAQTLADFVDRERRGRHFIVLGDFNSLPGSPVDRYLRDARGLVDAFARVKRLTDMQARKWPTAGFLNLRMHLDHIYASRAVEWIDFAGSHPFGHRGAFSGLSDHIPLIARCALD